MDNYELADHILLLSKLMDIHGENAFKSKSYAAAAFAIEKAPEELASLPREKIASVKGIGESVAKKIGELLEQGELVLTKEYLAKTPQGVLDMLTIKGLGPKKINTVWKELQIDNIDALTDACEKGTLAKVKGFGTKTEEKILESIRFQQQSSGSFLYAQVEEFAAALSAKIAAAFADEFTGVTGAFRRQLEVIHLLEWVTTVEKQKLKNFLSSAGLTLRSEEEAALLYTAENTLTLKFRLTTKEQYHTTLFKSSSSDEFIAAWGNLKGWDGTKGYSSEEEIFKACRIAFIPPFLREKREIIEKAEGGELPAVIQVTDVKGLIHSHSNWSDGSNTIEEMAEELIKLGFEYLVLSDHSKAAFYASGLSEQKIKEQHLHIDALNKKLAPFKIYKSIECDILSDGSLDYDNEVLASFDLVIASIHSNLQMTEEKAMLRLSGAITNPYITILGHLTGRRLLKRASYPVNYARVIDLCAANGVVIEINAHPERLDMQWEWIGYALQKGVMLSVNPDAHALDNFSNIRYGVLVAQKGGLTKEQNLSSMGRAQFEAFLEQRRRRV